MSDVDAVLKSMADGIAGALCGEASAAVARLREVERRCFAQIEAARLLDRAGAAAVLNVSLAKLDRLVRDGALPVVSIDRRPRFDPVEIRAFIERRKVGGGS